MRDLFHQLIDQIDAGRHVGFCSVIETRGSTPQKAGATMLVFADGTQIGTLGGGCVEAEVKRHAILTLNSNDLPAIHSFTLDDDYGWDDGLICGGKMTMLVAPLWQEQRFYYQTYRDLLDGGLGCTEVIAMPNNKSGIAPGSRWLLNQHNHLVCSLAYGVELPESVSQFLITLTKRPRPSVQQGFAIMPHLPRITVLIVGGGHVGQAVARLLADLEFETWVLDDRDKFANRDRFPHSTRHLVGDIGRTLQELVPDIHAGFYCLIVTRGHNHDEEALYHLCQTKAGYVGMIGSRRKIKLIYEDLIAKNIPEETLQKVHAPLGFEIGSQTVSEIAISIVAELIAQRNLGKIPQK